MESTCFKTQKLQHICKILGERCETEQGPFMTPFSKVLQNSFNVTHRNQTATETFTIPAISIFKRWKLILYLIFQNSKIFISLVMSLSSSCVKRTQSCISCIKRERKTEINIWWNFEVRSLLLRSLSQNTAVLTHVVMLLTQNWVKMGPNLYFMYQW